MIESNKPLSVSQLTSRIKSLMEETFPAVWVAGEISNFTHHSSGHMYFTLKDNRAELRVVMFRGHNQFLRFKPEHGMQVLVTGRISVYEQRGQYQLIIQSMEPAGLGTLYLAFEALKKQLAAEGLFDEKWKKPLPRFPRIIGIITSPTGAAIQDICQILARRAPYIELVLRPTLVQGKGAAEDIVQALQDFESFGKAEVLIVGRGGGSLEDLWSFNEEQVARAIHACPIPIISAVGHETDLSISDLIADLRAPTPSVAAELVAPARADLLSQLDVWDESLSRMMSHRLEQLWQRLDLLVSRYAFQQPQNRVRRHREQLDQFYNRLIQTYGFTMKIHTSRLHSIREKLEVLNPQHVLERGYSIAYTLPARQIIRTADGIKVGDPFELQTAKGHFTAEKTGDG